MKPAALFSFLIRFLALSCAALCVSSCSGDFARTKNPPRLVVEIDKMAKRGSPDAPIPLAVDVPFTYRITVKALAPDGSIDTGFNRYVRMSTKPGAIEPLTGPDTDGRNLLLKNGQSVATDLKLSNAYGITYIVADDLGYVPVDPLRQPPPACSNGIDDDGDGTIDFPADPGCAFANDDDESGGTYTEGSSEPIFFKLPRIADVRGLKCDPRLGCSGNGATPYPREQILLDTGYDDGSASFKFSTVIIRLAANGYFATDLGDTRGGFNSIFAFNFNAPPRMRVCDRLKTATGTANEFFGFTQLSYPTWTLEEWDPSKRPCLVPIPELLTPTTILDTPELLKRSGNLVRVETTTDGKTQKAFVTPKFGPGDVKKSAGGAYAATADASNCDFDKNGKINSFAMGEPEGECSTACTADPLCTEYSNYVSRGTFRITVTDSNGRQAAIQADASASAGFDPLATKGVLQKDGKTYLPTIRSFTGTMTFFSGGAQYTIEVRCKDDILLAQTEVPFTNDTPCMTDAECVEKNGLPPGYKCTQLAGSPAGQGVMKACRKPSVQSATALDPPPLACVFPRSFSDENPQ